MPDIHTIAKALKAKTDAGAVLLWGGDYFEKPKWRINKTEISFAQGNVRMMIWDKAEEWATASEAAKSLKEIRVLVDAK